MDLTTSYLGLTIKNPIIAGASPLNAELDTIRRLEEFGAAAVVLPSIFEEQIEHEDRLIEELIAVGSETYAEALSYFPVQTAYALEPDRYLELVRRAAKAVDIPVIASLNGTTDHGWVHYARQLQEAGASAIELNIYFIPSDLELSGRDVEQRYLNVLKAVRQAVSLPVAAKVGPYFSAPGHMAQQLERAGADGLVFFNRFYQPDIELATLSFRSDLELSRPYEMRLPLLWVGLLAGRVRASLAASTGVESADEVVKYLLAGADVVMTTASLLRHGIAHMKELVAGLESWLAARDLHSLKLIRGRMSRHNIGDPTAFERANYIKTLHAYNSRSELLR
jgi:dihydroorotate dehydrogenase (fumarate)